MCRDQQQALFAFFLATVVLVSCQLVKWALCM